MALNPPSSGLFSVNEFQTSPLPWAITGSTSNTTVVNYQFPCLTKSITFKNHDNSKAIRIGFTENGVNGVGGNYYFVVDGGDLVTLDVRVKDLFVRADTSNTISYSVYAGLTTIHSSQMPTISGSLPDGSAGWIGVG
jgi:hypothetical protein